MRVTAKDLRIGLAGYLRRASGGEEFEVTVRGRVVARLVAGPPDSLARALVPAERMRAMGSSLEGYTCTFEVRGKRCGVKASYWHGNMARCAEH